MIVNLYTKKYLDLSSDNISKSLQNQIEHVVPDQTIITYQ